MRRRFITIMGLSVILLSSACKTVLENKSSEKNLVANSAPETKNIALLVGARVLGEIDEINYRKTIPKMHSVLQELRGHSKLEIIERYQQTKQQILDGLETSARATGEDGTLFWYVSSHGRDGKLRSFDAETIEPEELVAALMRGRMFNGKLIPLRRLYVILDFCDAGVTVNAMKEQIAPASIQAVDLAHSLDDKSAEAIFGNALRDASLRPESQLQHQGPDLPVLLTEALIYSVTSETQSTYQFTFIDAIIDSLKNASANPKTSIGDFFGLVTENIAKKSQSTAYMRSVYPIPQRAILYAIPDNEILKEKFFDTLPAVTSGKEAACPPIGDYPWSYNHGRDSKGNCIDPAQFCQCIRRIDTNKNDVCMISKKSGTLLKWSSKATVEDENLGPITCYKTCDLIALQNKDAFLTQCDGNLIMRNPLNRYEMWSLRAKLSGTK